MNFQKMFKENKKEYLKEINNPPAQQIQINYLIKVLNSDYRTNKNGDKYIKKILKMINKFNYEFDPYSVNRFISIYMINPKTYRNKLTKFIENNNIISLNISYITNSSLNYPNDPGYGQSYNGLSTTL